jgi:hypothetical protein
MLLLLVVMHSPLVLDIANKIVRQQVRRRLALKLRQDRTLLVAVMVPPVAVVMPPVALLPLVIVGPPVIVLPIIVPPVAQIVPPVTVIMPPVALLPLAVVVPPAVVPSVAVFVLPVVVPRRRRAASSSCRVVVVPPIAVVMQSVACSMLQEQDEATRARRYRFGEQSERKKFTFYLELEKFQVDGGRNYYPTSLNFLSLALLS